MMEEILTYTWVILLGLCVGSFLNVLVYRLPRKINIGLSRSFCPCCRVKIKFYDNIPVISYLLLGGKCRYCRAEIPARYPLVELFNAGIYAYFLWHWGLGWQFFIYAFLASVLVTIIFIDVEFQIIPDMLTIPGIVVGLGVSILPSGIGITSALIGLLVGGGVLYLIAILGDLLFRKDSMGGGDIKMTAMLGAFLGWQKIVLIFFAGALIGLVISIIVMFFSKKVRSTRVIPFGPFLAAAAFLAIIYGDSIISFYISHFFNI
ncbi:MAG: prepilin peptidase [Candidatus Zixiibacteriota bacterium]|nr:MAG: prepilin peptidase [candidate division Zixibacteria bacterium]